MEFGMKWMLREGGVPLFVVWAWMTASVDGPKDGSGWAADCNTNINDPRMLFTAWQY